MTNQWDAVIIGGGPAGLSAAQMLGRSRRRTLVIDAGSPRNRFAARMHGVLGHDGLGPAELLQTGRAEASAYGVEISAGTVVSLVEEGPRLRVEREDGTVDTARVVVIASGLRDDLPAVPGLAAGWGETVLHCPYCHGWEVAGRRLAVLATSPASIHQVQLVRQLSDDVTVFSAAMEPWDDDAAAGLTARGIRVVRASVTGVRPGDHDLVITTDDGARTVVDALFTGGTPRLDLAYADSLQLRRSPAPGAPVDVDQTGATSHPRVFAAGNATSPFANIPVAMGAGSMAGAGANARLTAEDVEIAIAERAAARNGEWEDRYATAAGHFWSGRVNPAVASIAARLRPGTALDVGSGEGGDVVWLAEQGWDATGVDVSPTAVRRASDLAAARQVDARFVVGDGVDGIEDSYDLVLTSFLHSWEQDFPRIRILREAAARVRVGGRLLIVSHAAPPPWSGEHPEHVPTLRTPDEELALLELDPDEWDTELAEIRPRETTAPDGTPAHLDDGILLLHRRA